MRASPAPGCAHSKTQSVRLIAETLDPGQTWRVSSEQNARYGTAPRSSCSLPTAVIQIEGGTHWAGHMLPGTSWILRCSDAGHSGASRHQIRGVPGAPRRHANRSEAKTAARSRLRPLRMGRRHHPGYPSAGHRSTDADSPGMQNLYWDPGYLVYGCPPRREGWKDRRALSHMQPDDAPDGGLRQLLHLNQP